MKERSDQTGFGQNAKSKIGLLCNFTCCRIDDSHSLPWVCVTKDCVVRVAIREILNVFEKTMFDSFTMVLATAGRLRCREKLRAR